MSVEKCESVYCRQGRQLDEGNDGVCEVLKDLRRQVSMGTWTEKTVQALIKTHREHAEDSGCIRLQDIDSEEDELLVTAIAENIGEINPSDR